MLTKSRACFFWGRRSAAGSSDTDTKGLGILKSMNIHANHLYWFNKWQFVIATSIFWNHQICIRTYPMRGYLLTWYFINPSARGYLLTWHFINLGIAWILFNVDIFCSSDLSTLLPARIVSHGFMTYLWAPKALHDESKAMSSLLAQAWANREAPSLGQ